VVHAPYFANRIDWGTAAIFWFGRADVANGVAPIPGRNYADVRVACTSSELHVFVSVIDYYLWHEHNPNTSSNPTSYDYDGVALYLDINGDRTTAPGTDDYVFLAKWGASGEEYSQPYQRQARGLSSLTGVNQATATPPILMIALNLRSFSSSLSIPTGRRQA
jgi:hypothetical protein